MIIPARRGAALRARESGPLSASRSLMQLVRRGAALHLRAVCIHFCDRLPFFLFSSLHLFLSLARSLALSVGAEATERATSRLLLL